MRQPTRMAIWILAIVCAPARFHAWAQEPPKPPADTPSQDDEARRREWRDRAERMRNATPEERDRMRADGYVRMLTRTYDLTEEQQKRVLEQIIQSQKEYRESLGDDAKKLDEFRAEMGRYWRDQRGNGDSSQRPNPMDDPRYRDIMERMQEIQQRHPIDWEGSLKRIESLLPDDQVAAGRARREKWMAQNGGMGPWTGGPPGGAGGGPGWGRMNRGNNDQNGQGADDRRARRRDRRRGGPSDGAVPPPAQTGGGVAAQPPAPVVTVPEHPWDTYTETFIRTRGLAKNQITSARAIVKSLKEREAPIRKAQEPDRAAAAKLLDPKAREARIKQLDAPIDALFNELKQRLDALLTAAQRK